MQYQIEQFRRCLAAADEITYRRVLRFDRGKKLGRVAKRFRPS